MNDVIHFVDLVRHPVCSEAGASHAMTDKIKAYRATVDSLVLFLSLGER